MFLYLLISKLIYTFAMLIFLNNDEMNDNFFLVKLLVAIFSPFISLKLLNDGFYLYSIYCAIPWGMLIFHLCNQIGDFFDFEVSNPYIRDYSYSTYNVWGQREEEKKKILIEVGKKCQLKKNIVTMEAVPIFQEQKESPPLLPIKDIVALQLQKETEKKQKSDILDATQQKKLTVDINKLNSTTQQVTKQVVTTTIAKEAILIENDSTLPNNKLGVYKTIIEVLEKQELPNDKRYALYQSFAYIDAVKEGIIIYIDYNLLNKSQIDKSKLRQEEITIALRKALHCEQLLVVFEEYKSKTLLNYFLETKSYERTRS